MMGLKYFAVKNLFEYNDLVQIMFKITCSFSPKVSAFYIFTRPESVSDGILIRGFELNSNRTFLDKFDNSLKNSKI